MIVIQRVEAILQRQRQNRIVRKNSEQSDRIHTPSMVTINIQISIPDDIKRHRETVTDSIDLSQSDIY